MRGAGSGDIGDRGGEKRGSGTPYPQIGGVVVVDDC